jgi:hypothetical protein
MDTHAPSFPARLWLALVCAVRLPFDGEFAREVGLLRERGPVPSGPLVAFASTVSSVLSGTPAAPTPASAPTPAEVAAEVAAESAQHG